MVVRMNTYQVARGHLAACPGHVPARRIKLARVPFTLVLASGDGLGSRPMVFAAVGFVLGGTERRSGYQSGDNGHTQELHHGNLRTTPWVAS
jgi:hypothetical protein